MAGVNFPRFQTFDYGSAMKTKQDIEFGEMRNEATGLELNTQKDLIKNRQKANEIRTQIEGMPDQIDAMEQQGLFDQAQQLRDSYIDSQFNAVKLIETQRQGVNAENWDQWRYDLMQAGAVSENMLPAEYPGDGWFRQKKDEVKNKLQVQTRRWAEQGATFSQDFISDEFGDISWIGEQYKDPSKQKGGAGGKPWQMTSGDTNSIRNAAGQLYGTMWDPITEKYQGLNKTQQQEVASISELASKIYNANQGQLPHAEAVARAARQKGIVIEEMRQPGGGPNPLNLPGIQNPAPQR